MQETFVALMQRTEAPDEAGALLCADISQPGAELSAQLWRRIAREFESQRWFDRAADESPGEREAMHALAALPASNAR